MKRLFIGFRIYSNRFDIHFLAGTDDPYRDFSTVCNQYFFHRLHRHLSFPQFAFPRNKGWLYSTSWPSFTRISAISPSTSASISLNNFIASTMQTTWSAVTLVPTWT